MGLNTQTHKKQNNATPLPKKKSKSNNKHRTHTHTHTAQERTNKKYKQEQPEQGIEKKTTQTPCSDLRQSQTKAQAKGVSALTSSLVVISEVAR